MFSNTGVVRPRQTIELQLSHLFKMHIAVGIRGIHQSNLGILIFRPKIGKFLLASPVYLFMVITTRILHLLTYIRQKKIELKAIAKPALTQQHILHGLKIPRCFRSN